MFHFFKAVSIFLSKETVKTAVVSNVNSRLDIGNSLLAGICNCRKLPNSVTCGCKIKRLPHIQNNAARVVQPAWRQDHIAPVLHELHWVQYTILTIVFKCLHGLAPVYLTERLHLYQPSRSLHSQNQGLTPIIPITNSVKACDQMFSKVGPTLWMTLPKHIRDCQSFPSFKKQLKTHLFKLAYDYCTMLLMYIYGFFISLHIFFYAFKCTVIN